VTFAAFAAVYLIWGSTYLAIHVGLETLPPLWMAGVRFVFAGAILYAWERYRGAAAPTAAEWRNALALGFLMAVMGNGGTTWAQQHVPSGLAALMCAGAPIWMTLAGWLGGHIDRPRAGTVVGLLLGLLGIALLVRPGTGAVALGSVAVLLAGNISWAVGSVHSRKTSTQLGNAMLMLAGGGMLLGASLLLGEGPRVLAGGVTLRSGLALCYLTVFGSLVAFSAYAYLLRSVSPSAASTYAYVNPVIAVFLGWALLGEHVGPSTLVAAVIILAAVAMVTLSGRTRPQRSPVAPRQMARAA